MDLTGLSDDDLRAVLQKNWGAVSDTGLKYILAQQTPVKPQTGILAALKQGTRSFLSSSQTGLESLFGNEEDAARRGLRRSEQIQEQYPEQIGLDKIADVYRRDGLISAAGETLREIPLAIAQQAPNIGAMAASGRAGAALGSLAGPWGTAIGAGLGMMAPSLIQQLGGNVERQAAEGREDISVGRAAAAAVPQAALDVAGQYTVFGKAVLGKMLGKRVAALVERGMGDEAEQVARKALADETLFQTTRRGFVRGLAGEVPTEVAQQMLERAQAGLPLTDEDAMKEYADTAVQVGLLAPLGTAARFSEKGTARRKIADDLAEELKQKTEAEKAAKEKEAADAAEAKRLKTIEEQKAKEDYAPAQQAVVDLLKTTPDADETQIKAAIRATMGENVKGDKAGNLQKSRRTAALLKQFQEHGILPGAEPTEAAPVKKPAAPAEPEPEFIFTPDAIQEVPSAGPAEEVQSAAPEVGKIEPTPPIQERLDETAPAQPEQAAEPQPRADTAGVGAPVSPDVTRVGTAEVPDTAGVGAASVPVDADTGRKGRRQRAVAEPPAPVQAPVAEPPPAKPLKGTKRIQSLKDRLAQLEAAKALHPDDARGIREALEGRPVKKKLDKVDQALGNYEALAQHLAAIKQAEKRGELSRQDALALEDQAMGMDLFGKDLSEKLAAAEDQLRQTREDTVTQQVTAERQSAEAEQRKAKAEAADKIGDSYVQRVEAIEAQNRDLRAGEKGVKQRKLDAAIAAGLISDKAAKKAQKSIDRIPDAQPTPKQGMFLKAIDNLRKKFAKPHQHLMLMQLENRVLRAKTPEEFAALKQAIRDFQDPEASLNNPDLNEMRFDRGAPSEDTVYPTGMPAKEVERVVRETLAGMKNLPKITIRKLSDRLTRGYYDKKEGVVLNYGALRTRAMVRATLFHELLGHYALRTKFGRELLHLLRQLYDTNPMLRQESDAWIKQHWMPGYPVYDRRKVAFERAGMSPEAAAQRLEQEGQLLGVEETLADRASAGRTADPFFKSMWNQLVALVRDFARRAGMRVKFSDNDVAQIMRQAMDHVIHGGENRAAPAGRAYSRKGAFPKIAKAAAHEKETADDFLARRAKELDKKQDKPTVMSAVRKILLSHWWENYEKLVTNFQNDRRPLVTLQNYLKLAGRFITGFNDTFDQITRAPQEAHEQFARRAMLPMNEAKRLIGEYAKASKLSSTEALATLDGYYVALHESERRAGKYLRDVPLDNQKQFTIKGLKGSRSAAGWRDFLLKEIYRGEPVAEKDLAAHEKKMREYRKAADYLAANYYSALGESPMSRAHGRQVTLPQDINSPVYDVAGSDKREIWEELRNRYANDPNKELVDKIEAQLNILKEQTIEMNRKARYWSQGTDNLRMFYGYKHYVPLKGRPASQVSETDEQLELDEPRVITEAQFTQFAEATGGRKSEADNAISQIFTDAAMAATRYGYRNVAETIKNQLGKEKGIRGKVLSKDTIKFEDRLKGISRSDVVTQNTILHYDDNGTITPLRIDDPRFMEAIKRSFEIPNPLMKMVSDMTSFIGKMHTRYNPAFAPYNFVRDALTNAGIIKAEGGSAGKYLKTIATQTARFGLRKTWKVSKLYHEGRFAELDAMAKDPFVKDIVEWLEHGGRSAYLQGITNQGALEEFKKSLDKGRTIRTIDQANKYFDMWGDSFEFLARAAAYSAVKSDVLARLQKENGGQITKELEKKAKLEAAAYAKNLTNFESVGRYGKQAASLFMFFRPSATGAVRAIDSLLPALQSFDTVLRHAPRELQNDPAAVAAMRKNHAQRQATARAAIFAMLGAGASLYMMSVAMADGDDQDRNRTDADDPALWTRNIRLPIPGQNAWVQMPWGFGLGAFGAMGAQVAALARNNQSNRDGMTHMLHIAMDSFLPLPVSQIDPTENFFQWAFDSVMPSVVRPFFEYTVNMDALGRSIYNDRQSRYGDAYTGGDNVPEPYKQVARWMSSSFSDGFDVSPNTLYFWANNYADGLSRMAVSVAGLPMSLSGDKRVDLKHDIPGLSSFIGRNTSVDAREFASIKQQIEAKEARIRALSEKMGTDAFSAYMERHPEDTILVQLYRQQVNGAMKSLQERKNMINGMPSSQITPKDRRDQVDQLNTMLNLYKRNIIDMAKDLGVTP